MEKENFEKAKKIRNNIQHFEVTKIKVQSTKEREDDEEFNMLRQLAFDGCDYTINQLEKEFKEL